VKPDHDSEVSHKDYFTEMRSLLEDSDHADMHFLVGDTKVFAHKAILSARCDKFKAMFKPGSMRESAEGVVVVENHSVQSVRMMLEYIHADEVRDLEHCEHDEIIDLLSLSEEYLLPGLKSLCEESVKDKFTIENVLQLLSASDKYNASSLKQSCLDFILDPENLKESIKRPAFSQQLEDDSHLTMPILQAVANLLPSSRPHKRQKIECYSQVDLN
jgi:hypothetical protein